MSTEQRSPRPGSSRRTGSFGALIKRSISNDLLTERKASGSSTQLLRENGSESGVRSPTREPPPALPVVPSQPVIESFGGEDYVPSPVSTSMSARGTNGVTGVPPMPAIPTGFQNNTVDPYARTESMTHRSRYSYAHSTSSNVASPRRVRRRKDPTPYNILVIGAKNSGKTSFINFLKTSLALPARKQQLRSSDSDETPTIPKLYHNFTHHYQEIDIDHERVGLTLWDSEGLEKGVVDLQLRELTNFVESKFEETFAEEMKVLRSPGARDTQIHCIFMILDPVRLDTNMSLAQQNVSSSVGRIGKSTRIIGALDEDFELQVLRSFQGKTTVVPVISKADTITTAHMAHLKKMVWHSFKEAGLDPLEALNIVEGSDDQLDEDEDDDNIASGNAESEDISPPSSPPEVTNDTTLSSIRRSMSHKRNISKGSISSQMMDGGYVPMSILSPDQYSLDPSKGPVGRKFPWGFADPYDPEHCDFVKLKEAVFNEWRNEVREASREIFYERWRTNRLNRKAAAPRVQSPPVQTRKSSGGIPIQLMSSKTRT